MTLTRFIPGAGKVIKMRRFRSGKSISPLRQAEAYWNALRVGKDVPKRTEIDPRGIQNILEHAFILERIAPGIARFRLAGSHLNDLAGMEVRGMPLTAFATPGSRNRFGTAVEEMFQTPSVAEFELQSEPRRGRLPFEAKLLLLPLKSDLGDVSRALGVLVSDGDLGRAPVRFDITSHRMTAVSDIDDMPPPSAHQDAPARAPIKTPPASVPGSARTSSPASGFAESQAPLRRKVPYLRLVKSDD